MSFDVNDPLGDILSDGSNDSFFDEPKLSAKRSSLTKTPPKKSVSDLFNLDNNKPEVKKEVQKKTDDWLGLDTAGKEEEYRGAKAIISTTSPIKTSKLLKKKNFDYDDDIFGNLGLSSSSSNKPQIKREISYERTDNVVVPENKPSARKTDLLESILGPTKSEEKKITFDDILKDSKAITTAKTAEAKSQPASLIKIEPQQSFNDISREGRRGRRPSTGIIIDPLGLFSNESKPITDTDIKSINQDTSGTTDDIFKESNKPSEPDEDTKIKFKAVQAKSTPNIHDQSKQNLGLLPDWLGGSSIKPNKSEPALTQKTEELIIETAVVNNHQPEAPSPKIVAINDEQQQMMGSLLTQQKLARSNVEYQNSSIALQQQESQLLMALQLKKYEENLAEVQNQQQQILMKQEQQFNILLERQFEKQQIMENNMRLQQERINNHIQMLISQPSVVTKFPNQEELDEMKKSSNEENAKIFENMMSSLKQRHHEEMFLLEESYKKQILFLEQSLELTETRLKSDLTKITESFEEKLKQLSRQHEEEIAKYKQKMHEIEMQHGEEIKQIRENHTRIIEEIKFEHSTLLENIKQSKQSEVALFNESNSYVQKLDTNIEMLYRNSKNLQEIKGNVEKDYNILAKAREESIKAKEQEIVLMRIALEKCRESAEQERSQLLSLVRTLETKISEQNQNGREERWALQQAASTLAARSAALDRESEFNRASIEREREQLKALKEVIMAEQEKVLLQLTEEKLTLAAEKSRMETSSKLIMNYDSQRAKAEMDAVIQVAKEATEKTDREREHLIRQQCDLEKLKRNLFDHENKLNLKERELESLFQNAERKVNDGERALFQSKTLENKYNEQLKGLQNQLMSLSSREKKLAEEKIALSKERLALHTLIRQTKRCGLCAVDAPNLDDALNVNNMIAPHFPRFLNVDQDIVRLRFEAIEGEHNDDISINENLN